MTLKLIRFPSLLFTLFFLFVGPAFAQTFQEAPALAEQVQAGELPPVAERLPQSPMVVEPVEQIGSYGGAWRMGMAEGPDEGLLTRTLGYENLVRWDPAWEEVIPNVAESFEVSEDSTTYTFTLREGMKWSDGQPFTSADIVFWYEDVFLNEELSPEGTRSFLGGTLESVAAQGDTTVRFTFAEPNGLFLQQLATPNGALPTLYPRHYAERFHAAYNEDGLEQLVQEAGLASWSELFMAKLGEAGRYENPEIPVLFPWALTAPIGASTAQVVAERNPYYFKVDPEGNQLPYLDRLVFRFFGDRETMLLATLNGEIDFQERRIAYLSNKPVLFDNMERGDYGFIDTVSAQMNPMVLTLNLNHKDPVKREIFQNKDFRIGLSHAINRQELIDLIFVGQGQPHQAAPRPESEFYHEQLATQYTEYDPELANEHLDRAGFTERDAEGFRLGPDGQRISFAVETQTSGDIIDALELIKGYWREVGVDLQIRAIDRDLLEERRSANEYDALSAAGDGGLRDALLDPRWYFPFSDASTFALAWQAWYNTRGAEGRIEGVQPEEPPAATKRQMELYDQLRATSDPAEQQRLFMEILDIAAEEFYVMGVTLPAATYAVVKNDFQNVPATMPYAWLYPMPAPTNPEQYFWSDAP